MAVEKVHHAIGSKFTLQGKPSLAGHIQIARFDHWIKNVFVLPGILGALSFNPEKATFDLFWTMCIGLLSVGLVASSNYVINEILDAPCDRLHPVKRNRPVPSGRVSVSLAYAQWILLMVAGIGLASLLSFPFLLTMLFLWVMGCVYNAPPIRSKDSPYVDVLSEAINNPIRLLAGWFIVSPEAVVPASLLLSYWMVGCYFMAIKRFSEFRDLGNPKLASDYRKSFGFYTQERLLVSILFYGSTAMLFFGAFLIRYRLELVLSFPLIAMVMSTYLGMSFKKGSAAQAPEKLYRERFLVVCVISCAVVMGGLFFIDIPFLYQVFSPTLSTGFRS